jgi:hypothetical protein
MNKLVIGALTALAATQAAGCIITTDDGGDYATVGATWSIKNVSGATATSCPPGFDTVALFNVAVDSAGNQLAPCTGPGSVSDTCFVDLFNCAGTGSGVSAPLPPSQYQTWISITDSTGASTYAQSLSAFLDVRDIDLDFNASIFTDGGFFIMDWDLVAASNGAPVTCAQAGATGVETVVTVSGGSTMVDSGAGWPCEDFYGATAALPVGVYTVSVDAFSSAGALGVAPEFTSKQIMAPNRTTDLGTAVIEIDAL